MKRVFCNPAGEATLCDTDGERFGDSLGSATRLALAVTVACYPEAEHLPCSGLSWPPRMFVVSVIKRSN